MQDILSWTCVILTTTLLGIYEFQRAVWQKQKPLKAACLTHAKLREDWMIAVTRQKGTEILAVQTVRNAVMSATIIASVATLALMGFVTIAISSLQQTWISTTSSSPTLFLELLMSILLMASLTTSVMAVRFYNHLSFIVGIPVDSDLRNTWSELGEKYAKRAGLLYSASLRYFVMMIPILAAILWIPLGPFAALVLLIALSRFNRA